MKTNQGTESREVGLSTFEILALSVVLLLLSRQLIFLLTPVQFSRSLTIDGDTTLPALLSALVRLPCKQTEKQQRNNHSTNNIQPCRHHVDQRHKQLRTETNSIWKRLEKVRQLSKLDTYKHTSPFQRRPYDERRIYVDVQLGLSLTWTIHFCHLSPKSVKESVRFMYPAPRARVLWNFVS